MRQLEKGELMTLAQLSEATGIPKSSALRILRTLTSLGILAQSQYKGVLAYFPLQRLVPYQNPSQVNRRILLDILTDLALGCEVSAEWFVPVREGMMLIHRAEPPGHQVRVAATEGTIFEWGDNFGAIIALGYAFFDAPAAPDSMLSYIEDGKKERIAFEIIEKTVNQVRETGWSEDRFWNENGVRRIASIVRFEGKPVGVLSTARNQRPDEEIRVHNIRKRVKESVQKVELKCGTALLESIKVYNNRPFHKATDVET